MDQGLTSVLRGFTLCPGLIRGQQLVADATDGGDHRLVLGAELGPEAADVDVHGAGAAEEVVAPDLLEELGPGRDPARPGGQEPQQLELLVGQVERPPAQADLVGDGVDDQVADPDGGVGVGHHRALGQQPQPGLDLGRPGAGQDDVVGGGLEVELDPPERGPTRPGTYQFTTRPRLTNSATSTCTPGVAMRCATGSVRPTPPPSVTMSQCTAKSAAPTSGPSGSMR